ncbi:MAG: phosphatidylglycerol lysyltransferase domain-containing protein [Alphaproteobacteria bacterium]|nr:phosphatidylglycerol lysyltransferase domain-containing protein [Alphaproteobacteria bacterium]
MNALSRPNRRIPSSGNLLEAWEQRVEQLPNVKRIEPANHAFLQSCLQSNADSYLTSPLYFLYTGRNGLWAYSAFGKSILFCWHPNREGHVLVFPASDAASLKALASLLRMLPTPPLGLRLARVPTDASLDKITNGLKAVTGRSLTHRILSEDVMDWRYPARILATENLVTLLGRKLGDVRNGLARARRYQAVRAPLQADLHKNGLSRLIHQWAARTSVSRESYFDRYDFHESLFSMLRGQSAMAEGMVFLIDGQIEAVSLWDVSKGAKPTANLHANISNPQFPRLAELALVETASALHASGVEFLNLGGSETESLDFFKNKFCPALSLELCSIDITLSEDAIVPSFSSVTKKSFYDQAG